ncbi:hypothetical protein G7Y79_00010g028460 [Physcia stellaris]|nr:hypothetical protein G7Y79_00010g028460 [Physcia stellaris]
MLLPTDILYTIFAELSEHHLPKPALKSARLVCKAWALQASPFLFDNVFITARHADLQVAQSLASTFGHYVKTLTYSWEHFRQWSTPNEYFERVDEMCYEEPVPACFDAHTRQSWDTYDRLRKEKEDIGTEEQQILHLVRAFKDMPRITRIKVTCSWRQRGQCWCMQALTDARQREKNPWKQEWLCPDDNCTFSAYHRGRCVTSHAPSSSDRRLEQWRVLMHALQKAGKSVKEILIEDPEEAKSDLPAEVFIPSFGLTHIMKNVFSSLTKLQLSLSLTKLPPDFGHAVPEIKLRQVLKTAINLSSLHISLLDESWREIEVEYEEPLLTMFVGCSFPKLRFLSLDGCGSTEIQLLQFLEHTPDLHELSLRRYALTDGFWRPVVQELRDSSRIKTLHLSELQGDMENGDLIGFEDSYFEVEAYGIDHVIEEFFYREKGSQFTTDELELILKEGEMRSRFEFPSDGSEVEDLLEGMGSASESELELYEDEEVIERYEYPGDDEYWSE